MFYTEQNPLKTAAEPKGSRLNLPSIADVLGIKTDNRWLNWQGIFGGEPRHRVDVDPEDLERVRKHHRFMANMTRMALNAIPFVGPVIGGVGVIKGVSREKGIAIRQKMARENSLRGTRTKALVDEVARGLWLHGRGTYPEQGATFKGSRAATGNLGEPSGLSLTADKELLKKSFAKPPKGQVEAQEAAESDYEFLNSSLSIKVGGKNVRSILNSLLSGENSLYKRNYEKWLRGEEVGGVGKKYYPQVREVLDDPIKKDSYLRLKAKVDAAKKESDRLFTDATPFARVFPQFGGKPEDKIIRAWVSPETVKDQQVLKEAYIESLPDFIKRELKVANEGWKNLRTGGEGLKDLFEMISHNEGVVEDFNKRISQNLLSKGYKALQYSPERYNEYEMRMLDPDDVLMLDMRTQEDPALGRMYGERKVMLEGEKRAGTPKKYAYHVTETGKQKKRMGDWQAGASPREGSSLRDIYKTITWEDIEGVLGKDHFEDDDKETK